MEKIVICEPILLTAEQKKELIDICNKIWPELDFHFWLNDDGDDEEYFGFSTTVVGDHTYDYLYIHWFEFVVKMILSNDLDELEAFYNKLTD